MKSRNRTKIRIAAENDAEKLLDIYAYYVEHTAITFEYKTPSADEFRSRIRKTLSRYPYIVLESGGVIAGYAYAGSFNERSAYDWSAETTIYMKKDMRKNGYGRELYTALEQALSLQNIINLNACIGYPIEEDEYLTGNSVDFHSHMGYKLAGKFHKCGYKFGRWYDMVWMEKAISAHPDNPQPVRTFDEIRGELAKLYGIN